MNRRCGMFVSLILLWQFCSVNSVYAWNDFGHMTVACVAYKNLKPQIRGRVDKLMRLNPYYETWKKALGTSLTERDLNAQIFMLSATWPDLIKKDSNYISDGTSDGNRPEGPNANLNVGYSDHLMHKYWHFYDMPFAEDGLKELPQIPSPNAQTQIAVCRKILSSSRASDDLKSYDLTWLMHIVGDLHQPLHCITRASKFALDGDNGGNDVLVNFDDKKDYKLHAFWDNCLGSGPPPEAQNFAAQLPAQSNAALATDKNVGDWIKESNSLAKQQVYVNPIRWGKGPFELTPVYRNHAVQLCKTRAELAGERLANIINTELK